MTVPSPYGPVQVQLFTGAEVIRGNCHATDERRRLGDVLNEDGNQILLGPAQVATLEGSQRAVYAELTTFKNLVRVAIPLETPQQLESQSLYRRDLVLPQKARVRLHVEVGSYTTEGDIHVFYTSEWKHLLAPTSEGKDRLASASSLRQFFPLTNARLWWEDQPPMEIDVLFLNREHVSGVAWLNDEVPVRSLMDLLGGLAA